MPPHYTTRIDTPGGFQRVVVSDPAKKEKKVKPELYMTVYEPGKIRLHYSPYDHFDEYHYYGEMDLDDSKKVDDCLKTILAAMQGNKKDLIELEKDLDLYGIRKQFASSKKEPADVTA